MNTTAQTNLQLKVCGITSYANALEVASLNPDMMGFILYQGSKRYVSIEAIQTICLDLPKKIKRVAVLVNSPLNEAIQVAESKFFDYIQLHGNETPEYCKVLNNYICLIKAFGIAESIPKNIDAYIEYCQLFLFDTKSKSYGGTGKKFDHTVLSSYSHRIPFFISGGIETEDIERIQQLKLQSLTGVDVNSRFETTAGIKNVTKLRELTNKIK